MRTSRASNCSMAPRASPGDDLPSATDGRKGGAPRPIGELGLDPPRIDQGWVPSLYEPGPCRRS